MLNVKNFYKTLEKATLHNHAVLHEGTFSYKKPKLHHFATKCCAICILNVIYNRWQIVFEEKQQHVTESKKYCINTLT